MLELAFITSLKVVFVWAAMQEGMILHWLRRLIDWMISPLPPKVFLWLRKPMYDCLFCCSSVYGLLFTWYYEMTILEHIELIITVSGINYIIQWLITDKQWAKYKNSKK